MQLFVVSLLLGHFIGDFLFQSDHQATRKVFDGAVLLKHCLLYLLGMFIGLVFGIDIFSAVIIALVAAILHAGIDLAGAWVIRRQSKREDASGIRGSGLRPGQRELLRFVVDQLLHGLVILLLALLVFPLVIARPMPLLETWWTLGFSGSSYFNAVLIATLAVFCTQPSLVIVRKVLEAVEIRRNTQPEFTSADSASTDSAPDIDAELPHQKAGRVIGILERLVVLALGLSGNFMALGFVVAVKGLARFKQFDEQDFAEVFLVGTLASMLLAIVAVLVGLKMLN